MRQRLGLLALLAGGALGLSAQPAAAQQTLNFSFGYFTVRGEDARVEGDILNEHLGAAMRRWCSTSSDFNGATVGAEWLVPLGQYLEAGAGVSFSRRTVPSVYEASSTRTARRSSRTCACVACRSPSRSGCCRSARSRASSRTSAADSRSFSWRYSESGEFVDFSRRNAIFREQFVASGSETGPVVLGGIRFAGDSLSAGAEVRYHSADGRPRHRASGPPTPIRRSISAAGPISSRSACASDVGTHDSRRTRQRPNFAGSWAL